MNADRIVFISAMLIGVPVLAWKIGYDAGLNNSANYCPAVQQNERLAYSTQTLHGTECMYIQHTTGKAKKARKA